MDAVVGIYYSEKKKPLIMGQGGGGARDYRSHLIQKDVSHANSLRFQRVEERRGHSKLHMAKLPNAERAVVSIEKLRDYSLNPEHPEGKHKARVFQAAFGFTQADAATLREMVLEAANTGEATTGKTISHGQMYVVDFIAPGLLRRDVTIRTAWLVAKNTDFPRLVSCYVKGKRK